MFTPGLGACAYKTASGRRQWLNRDPIQEWASLNLYQYIYNNASYWIDPFGLDCRFTLGIGGTVGGNPSGAFGPFVGGGLSVGLTSRGQLLIQFQGSWMAGAGAFAGVGFQGGFSHSKDSTPAGITTDTAIHAEANVGLEESGGIGADLNGKGQGIGFPVVGRLGAGVGIMAGAGESTTTTIATPPLFPAFSHRGINRSDETPPVIYFNAPPTTVTPPCHCNS